VIYFDLVLHCGFDLTKAVQSAIDANRLHILKDLKSRGILFQHFDTVKFAIATGNIPFCNWLVEQKYLMSDMLYSAVVGSKLVRMADWLSTAFVLLKWYVSKA
jgi:hypothetical protein